MTTRTILLVDDDNDLRETLMEQLSLYEEFIILQEPTAAKGIADGACPADCASDHGCRPA